MDDKELDKSKKQNAVNETESMLLALDQISQTIDVMNSVVGRLRNHIIEHSKQTEQQDLAALTSADRIIH